MSYVTSSRRIYIGVFSFLAVVIGLHYLGWLKPIEEFLYDLIVPASANMHRFSVNIGEGYQFFTNKDDFLKRYAACSEDLTKEQIVIAENKQLNDENAELKKQLHYVQGQKNSSLLAEVVGREIAGTEKTIIISLSTASGVIPGQPVLSGEGILVGKIIKVEGSIAFVRLINDPSSKIEVSILNTDHSIGILEGGYGITLKMKFVPRNEVIKVDDQIITSGYEPLLPRGLVLGKVVEVQNQANQGFQDIAVVSSIDLSKLTSVTILLTK